MSYSKLISCVAFLCMATIGFSQVPCGIDAGFYWQPNPNNVPVFYDSTSVDDGWIIVSYQWNFGDGQTSTSENPSHFFANPGNYEVCLTVVAQNENTNETCTDVLCQQYVQCGTVSGNFTYQVDGNLITFFASGNAQYGPPAFLWTFGDNSLTMEGQVVEHQFSATGVYQVCLTILDANSCSHNVCQSVIINSTSCVGIEASFEYSISGGNLVVESTSTTNGMPLQYQWSLNGLPSASAQQATEWVNLPAGTYVACLTVGAMGSVCDTHCETIVIESNPLCQGFAVSIINMPDQENGSTWLSADAVTGGTGPYTYLWNNGSTDIMINVPANNGGLYCVTVYDNNQCSATDCDTVGFSGGCNLQLQISGSTNNGITVLQAIPIGGVGPYTYYMNNSLVGGPTFTTEVSGTYCFTVVDVQGCTATNCYVVGGSITYDTICGYVFNDLNGNGIFNETEEGIENTYVYLGNYTAITNADGYWQAIVPSGTYYAYYCAGGGNIITTPFNSNPSGTNANCANYYAISSSGANGNCNYNFGVQLVSVNICGRVFFDSDDDGVFDQNDESGINAVQVLITSSNGQTFTTYTNYSGNYCIYVPAGEYTIHIGSSAFNTCDVQPLEIGITGTAGQNYSNQNFAVQCPPGTCNLAIDVVPSTTVTPGFPGWYNVYVCNQGATVASGTANYFYDNSALTFNYSTPAATTQNSANGHISWNVSNLLPGQCTSFWVNFSSPTTTQLGSSVFTLASIDAACNDYNLLNNVDSLHQIVVGSWDPNNKLAYKTNHDSNTAYQWISSINSDQRIEYVINFQNTGSAPAVNVVIEDIISTDLDISTLEVLGASHSMYTIINGNDVNFRFPNIYLPDSTNNEPESHGYVRFAIKAVNNLPAGHIISDDAAIYFDFNEPVITNDAAVELLNVVGIDEVTNPSHILVYPNPMDKLVQFKNQNGKSFRLRITDAMGRTVADEKSTSDIITIERGSLASGLYLYQVIESDNVTANGKLIVR